MEMEEGMVVAVETVAVEEEEEGTVEAVVGHRK